LRVGNRVLRAVATDERGNLVAIECTTVATRLALALGDGEPLLRVLTGRGQLSPKLSVF
jgi:hypothetical protein